MFFRKKIKKLLFKDIASINVCFYEGDTPANFEKDLKNDFKTIRSNGQLIIIEKNIFKKTLKININGLEKIKFISSDVFISNFKESGQLNIGSKLEMFFDYSAVRFNSFFNKDLKIKTYDSRLYLENCFIENFDLDLLGNSNIETKNTYISMAELFIDSLSYAELWKLETYIINARVYIENNGLCHLQVISRLEYSIDGRDSIIVDGDPVIYELPNKRDKNGNTRKKTSALIIKNKMKIKNAVKVPHMLISEIEQSLLTSFETSRLDMPSILIEAIAISSNLKIKEHLEKSSIIKEQKKLRKKEARDRSILEKKKLENKIINKDKKEFLELLEKDRPSCFISIENSDKLIKMLIDSFSFGDDLSEKQLKNRKKLCVLFDIDFRDSEVLF